MADRRRTAQTASQKRRNEVDAEVEASIGRDDVLAAKMDHVSSRLGNVESTLSSLAQSMTALVRLEERHDALAKTLDHVHEEVHIHDRRIEAIDTTLGSINGSIAPLVETRKWVITGIMAVIAMVGATVYNTVENHQRNTQMFGAGVPTYEVQAPRSVAPVPVPHVDVTPHASTVE